MREAKNEVKIEGILSEIDIKVGSFVKGGETIENISGSIKVRVDSPEGQLEIPVHLYSNKLTTKGAPNPAYVSIEKVMKEFTSIAASDEAHADRIRLTGKLRMNEYPGQDGRITSYPRITTSFINRVKKEEMRPQATFSVEFVIAQMGFELDKDGVETSTYTIKGIIPQWGDAVDVIPFHVSNDNVRSAISSFWQQDDCVQAEGRLNFTSTTETKIIQPDFGEPREETRTINLSELLITGGCSTPLSGDMAWSMEDITAALADRKARLEAAIEKGKTKAAQKKAPAQNASAATKGFDLGF